MIELKNITKSFDGLKALSNVSIKIPDGGMHAFLGENGAGKSTLMKILSGHYAPDSGQIKINGEAVSFKSTLDSMSLGIGMIYQDFTLIDSLKIWENFVFTLPSFKGKNKFFIKKRHIVNNIIEYSNNIGFKIDPDRYVGELSEGEKQKVEIVELLMSGAKFLIFDEPTSLLTPREAENFLGRLREMSNKGFTIILITHKLKEALEFTDNVTILRGGQIIADFFSKEVSEPEIAKIMVGKLPDLKISEKNRHEITGETVLEMINVGFYSNGKRELKNINLEIKKGEILGIAGISGEGQSEIAEIAAGYSSSNCGNVKWNFLDTCANISFIPENPREEAVVEDFSLLDNLLIKRDVFLKPFFISKIFYNDFKLKASSLIKKFKIKPSNPNMLSRNLSGGNLQKLVLARELYEHPDLFVALYPTKGLDISATNFFRNKILQIASNGTAVLFFSEDIDELALIADRIMVLRDGEIVGSGIPENFSAEDIGLLMGGDLELHN